MQTSEAKTDPIDELKSEEKIHDSDSREWRANAAAYCRVAGIESIERESNGYTWVVSVSGERVPIGHT